MQIWPEFEGCFDRGREGGSFGIKAGIEVVARKKIFLAGFGKAVTFDLVV
jgi:hypothetical protein